MPQHELTPGTILAGKYRIDRVIGEGGMGIVLGAEHTGLGRPVAIKLLQVEASDELVERFRREARVAAGLASVHVPQVFDIDRLDTGEPYLVMELLRGVDLAQLLERQTRLAVPEALDYLLQACEALGQAEARGIVHRDLKPANLFLASDGRGGAVIKVLDFGLAKLGAELDSPQQVALTRTGSFFGSPAYMSPEQWMSPKSADARSDVWSLGCILYELLTGRVPFGGDNLGDLFRAAVEARPTSPRALVADIPQALDAVVMRCLEKDRAQRYSGASELATALAPILAAERAGALASTPSPVPAPSSPEQAPSWRSGQSSPERDASWPAAPFGAGPSATGPTLPAESAEPAARLALPAGSMPSGAWHPATAVQATRSDGHSSDAGIPAPEIAHAGLARRRGPSRAAWIAIALGAFVLILLGTFLVASPQARRQMGPGSRRAVARWVDRPASELPVPDESAPVPALAEIFESPRPSLTTVLDAAGNPPEVLWLQLASVTTAVGVPVAGDDGSVERWMLLRSPAQPPRPARSSKTGWEQALKAFKLREANLAPLAKLVRHAMRQTGAPKSSNLAATLGRLSDGDFAWFVTVTDTVGGKLHSLVYDQDGVLLGAGKMADLKRPGQ